MRRFVTQCLLFTLMTVSVAVGLWYAVIGSQLDKTLVLPADKHILLIGNSHFRFGLNDSIITGAVNISTESDPVDVMYRKLVSIHSINPMVDTVVISVDNVSIYDTKPSYDDVHYHAEDLQSWSLGDISFMLSRLQTEALYSQMMKSLRVSSAYVYYRRKPDANTSLSGIGKFEELTAGHLKEDINFLKKTGRAIPDKFEITPFVRHYVDKIVSYCEQNDITLIFMCTPQHRIAYYDDTYYRDLIVRCYPGVKYLDYYKYPMPDSCFRDLDHLNVKGARAFSTRIEHTRFNDPEWEYPHRR